MGWRSLCEGGYLLSGRRWSPRERGGAVSERLPLLNESYTHLHIDGFSEVVCIAGDDPRLAK